LAQHYNLPFRVFALGTPDLTAAQLKDVDVLLLAAGPFSATSGPALEACLRAGTHYLDITGEVSVFEANMLQHEAARKAGIVIMSGVGFDVVPSDCLAGALHKALPDGNVLQLAIAAIGSPSPGTMKTMVEGFPQGGAIRKDGKLTKVPSAWKSMTVPFKRGPRSAMTIPWGDISTAYRSTGIPNIEVYMVFPPAMIQLAKRSGPAARLLGFAPLQKLIKAQIDKRVEGPSAGDRKSGRSLLWGKLTDPAGKSVEGQMETMEGYQLTAWTGIDIAARVLAGEVKPGYSTPAMAFGPDYIRSVPGTSLEIS
jgi:short subunit dehydrogenase-like uncharacterized protein